VLVWKVLDEADEPLRVDDDEFVSPLEDSRFLEKLLPGLVEANRC
jgi:hypothetical protein